MATGDAVPTILPQQFYKEVILWSTLSHPNVLGLVGAQEDIKKRQLVVVSERMMYGNIMEYIKENHANRLELVRDFALLTVSFTKIQGQLHGAAQGLEYLHGVGLTHGDLKGVGVSQFRDRSLSDI